MEIVFRFLSSVVLLIISCYFGFVSQPAEMGLAILAGAIGLAFSNIDKLSEFSGAGFTAKMKNQIQAIVEKETEVTFEKNDESEIIIFSPIEESILKTLSNSKYTWRTFTGIRKDAGCGESEAWKVLNSLVSKKLVRITNKNNTGEIIWSLTHIGRQLTARIE